MSKTDSDAQQDQDSDPTPDNPGLPRLVRVYLRQVAIGFVLSAVFVGLLLGLNVANLRSLMLATQGGAIAGFLLFFFNGLIFAGVQFGITIMRMAVSEDKTPRGGRRAPVAVAQPARVRVATGR
jgi:hypothetical protein